MDGPLDVICVLYFDPNASDPIGSHLECAEERLSVVTATTADEALRVLEDVDCFVCEYEWEFSRTDDWEVLDAVRNRCPSLPIVFVPDRCVDDTGNRVLVTEEETITGEDVLQITEHIREVVWVTDAQNEEILYVNPAYETVWGRPVETLYENPSSFLETLHPDDRTRVRDAIRKQHEGDYDETYRIVRPDGDVRWVRDRAVPVPDENGDVHRIVGIAEDITESKERKRELERSRHKYQSLIDCAPDPIFLADADSGLILEANQRAADLLGYTQADLVGMHFTELHPPDDRDRARRTFARSSVDEQEQFSTYEDGSQLYLYTSSEERIPVEVNKSVFEFDGSTLATAIIRDITDRLEYESTLEEVNRIARTLLQCTSFDEIGTQIADGIYALDGFSSVVYEYDAAGNVLRPVRSSRDVSPDAPLTTVVEPGADERWEAYIEGTTVTADRTGLTDDLRAAVPETVDAVALFPLLEDGLLAVYGDDGRLLEERSIELLDTLVASAESALERTTREADLRERDAKIRAQNETLRRLDEVNERIRQIGHDLLAARTKEDVARIVVDGLQTVPEYECIALVEPGTDRRRPLALAKSCARSNYFDVLSCSHEGSEPTVRTLREERPTVVSEIASNLRESTWRREAVTNGLLSVVSVPVRYDGVLYGALTIYATTVDAFTADTRDVLLEFGETIARTISLVEQQRAVQSNDQVELEFELAGTKTPLTVLADALGGHISIDRVVPRSAGEYLAFGRGTDVSVEEVESRLEELESVDRVLSLVQVHTDVHFEIRLESGVMPVAVTKHGGIVRELTVRDGVTRLVAVLPAGGTVTQFVRMFVDRYPNAELLARRENPSQPVTLSPEAEMTDALTDRQRETVRVAYERGFFDWPRESTGEEIAADLGIAPSTFHRHIRQAEETVFRLLL